MVTCSFLQLWEYHNCDNHIAVTNNAYVVALNPTML